MKAAREKYLIHMGKTRRMAVLFSSETMGGHKGGARHFSSGKRKRTTILYKVKLSFKDAGGIKTFSDERKGR